MRKIKVYEKEGRTRDEKEDCFPLKNSEKYIK